MTKRWALYDLTIEGELAYVGITNNPKARMTQHKTSRTVPYFAKMVIVEWFDTRKAAAAAEDARIKTLKPPRNIKGAQDNGTWIAHEAWVIRV